MPGVPRDVATAYKNQFMKLWGDSPLPYGSEPLAALLAGLSQMESAKDGTTPEARQAAWWKRLKEKYGFEK
jgi:hypothetical protein